ncbi:MAG: asparagine synthase (glutamine-hydrolyzing), partial [Pyrinomonadaceae bacterium]
MCGIAGLIHSEAGQRIAAMLESIEHRGRDDEGVWTRSVVDDSSNRSSRSSDGDNEEASELCVALGHRRLAIIDTSRAGHQPMLSEDERYTLTFNGEIYNYI